jgi:hypothetical protein
VLLAVAGLVNDEGHLLTLGVVQTLALAGVGVVVGDVAWQLMEAERQRMEQSERARQRAKLQAPGRGRRA